MRKMQPRVWIKPESKMRLVQKIEFDDFGNIHTVGWFGDEGEMLFNVGHEVNRTMEIMWPTNLKDLHGKEIYEGDIVRAVDNDLGNSWITDIYLNEEEAQFQFREIGTPYSYDEVLGDWANFGDEDVYVEVIGNIYENSDMLDSEDDTWKLTEKGKKVFSS